MMDRILRLSRTNISPYSAHQAQTVKRSSALLIIGGFTIIEVMIVLAIAALIFLVVFLAVPALQRNQRNNARGNDVNRMSAAIIARTAKTGAVPNSASDVTTLITDMGTPGGYPSTLAVAATLATAQSGRVSLVTGTQAALATTLTDALQIVTGAGCTGTAGATAAGGAKEIAIQYTLETSSSTTSTVYCQDVQ